MPGRIVAAVACIDLARVHRERLVEARGLIAGASLLGVGAMGLRLRLHSSSYAATLHHLKNSP
ncbi:MAG: hypothetical protein BGO98_26235 [Myxococcales bacterium 68-20]|nr:MAG: hypothetical protein BGO98_26235 [Myxococcales bacterium 68-20]